MKIQNYLKNFISWEDFKRANVQSVAPFREVVDFKAAAKKAGLSLEEASRKLFDACYIKTTATDCGGYPKYKLNKKAVFEL